MGACQERLKTLFCCARQVLVQETSLQEGLRGNCLCSDFKVGKVQLENELLWTNSAPMELRIYYILQYWCIWWWLWGCFCCVSLTLEQLIRHWKVQQWCNGRLFWKNTGERSEMTFCRTTVRWRRVLKDQQSRKMPGKSKRHSNPFPKLIGNK